MHISGEVDLVKPSPRQFDTNKNSNKNTSINSVLNKNGINLTQEQLMSLLSAIQANDATNRPNYDRNDDDAYYNSHQNGRASNRNYNQNFNDDISIYRPPQVVIASEDDEIEFNNHKQKSTSLEQLNANTKPSLLDKKKLKWQQDKGR